MVGGTYLPESGTDDYWSAKLKNSLVILPENDFRDFTLYATEVITRIRIDRNTKTAARGALWTEEHLPTDTLLYVPMYATDARDAMGKRASKFQAGRCWKRSKRKIGREGAICNWVAMKQLGVAWYTSVGI